MEKITLLLVFVFLTIASSESARILAIIPTPSYSHQVAYQKLWKDLSLRGHQVTTITTDPIHDPNLVNLTEIDLKISYKWLEKYRQEIVNARFPKSLHQVYSVLIEISDAQLAQPDVQALIKSDQSFDLVMVEIGRFPYVVFAEKFNCPLIGISSLTIQNSLLRILGNPVHSSVFPDFKSVEATTLFGRVRSFVYDALLTFFWGTYLMSLSQDIADKHFGKNYSSVTSILENTSLIFVTSDPVFHKLPPTLSNIIEIGGDLYRASTEELPKDLQKILDNAKQGFIYFSLGSNARSEEMPESIVDMFADTLAELSYLVLWKFDGVLKHSPKNVITQAWWPQSAILRHPNIKLFITQGGLQSLEEARFYKVPIVGVPVFADQWQNVKQLVLRGEGLSVDSHNLNKNILKSAILEVIQNSMYRNNIEELRDLALDTPMSGIDKAIWWTEFVIRHKGAKHLRSPFLDVPLYQYYFLDVFAVLMISFLGMISVIIFIIRLLSITMGHFFVKKTTRVKCD